MNGLIRADKISMKETGAIRLFIRFDLRQMYFRAVAKEVTS